MDQTETEKLVINKLINNHAKSKILLTYWIYCFPFAILLEIIPWIFLSIRSSFQFVVCFLLSENGSDFKIEPFQIEMPRTKDSENGVDGKDVRDDLIIDKKADKTVPVKDAENKDKLLPGDYYGDDIKEDGSLKDSEKAKDSNPFDDDYGYKTITELKTPCEELEYERLKNNLLQYHCARIGEMDCTTDPASKYCFIVVYLGEVTQYASR